MKPLIALLTIGVLLGGALDAQAQSRSKNASKAGSGVHYRWEDEQGRVHFSDTVPLEALHQGRTVYRGGQVVKQVERSLTVEEIAQQEALKEQELAEAARKEEERKARELLERSYPDADAVRADFAQRKVYYSDRITASEATIAQHRRVLASRLERAANLELGNKKVPPKLAAEIHEAVGVVRQHQKQIDQAHESIAQLSAQEAQVIKDLGW